MRELEFGSLLIILGEENQSLKENLNLLKERLNDAKTFFGLEKINRKTEKRKLVEKNESLSNKTLELKQKIKSLEENNKSLGLTCFELSEWSIDLLAQVNELKEHDKKSLSLIVQENVKKAKTLGKERKEWRRMRVTPKRP